MNIENPSTFYFTDSRHHMVDLALSIALKEIREGRKTLLVHSNLRIEMNINDLDNKDILLFAKLRMHSCRSIKMFYSILFQLEENGFDSIVIVDLHQIINTEQTHLKYLAISKLLYMIELLRENEKRAFSFSVIDIDENKRLYKPSNGSELHISFLLTRKQNVLNVLYKEKVYEFFGSKICFDQETQKNKIVRFSVINEDLLNIQKEYSRYKDRF